MSQPLPPLDDAAPAAVRAEMAALRAALDATVPRKRQLDRNLLVATWNLKEFGSLTEKWDAGARDTPKRDWRALWAIAEIVSRFDVVALQEVTGNLRALRTLMKTLGPRWQFVMTDVTRGEAGGGERMAFVFDGARVELSGLAGELVVPPEWIAGTDPSIALRRQFARTPYTVSFRAGDATVILVAMHVLYGSAAADRVPELHGIARWMADWAQQTSRWHHNLVVLGDFNIDRRDDALWQAFTSTGLTVPEALHAVPRSIFADPAKPALDKFYDQIAWFTDRKRQLIDLRAGAAGSVDFVPHLYRDVGLTRAQMQYRVSDHYPLWVEFV
ncbi:endonuclease/exonuclease/phosphatase family protein [Azohydromonas sediminis]|uniref:endonuclease/exonuclease/phosphatase family protein n=1 Tax=Azohydromonas sediminis TaxID=2259674 RepID=UPI001B356C83|nr:endonuclease/exonuclease/phosphatase family protein [Azohydromonas sediminis]